MNGKKKKVNKAGKGVNNPKTPAQKKYNAAAKKYRADIKRAYGTDTRNKVGSGPGTSKVKKSKKY